MRAVKRRYTTIKDSVDYWGARFYEQGDGFDDVLKMALAEQLAALSPTWSAAKPTVPGWYWYRDTAEVSPVIVQVFVEGPRLQDCYVRGLDFTWSLKTLRGSWAGPLVLPREK